MGLKDSGKPPRNGSLYPGTPGPSWILFFPTIWGYLWMEFCGSGQEQWYFGLNGFYSPCEEETALPWVFFNSMICHKGSLPSCDDDANKKDKTDCCSVKCLFSLCGQQWWRSLLIFTDEKHPWDGTWQYMCFHPGLGSLWLLLMLPHKKPYFEPPLPPTTGAPPKT